jgi:hypothetical protein
MARFEPISTHIFPYSVNNSDSLTIGKTFIGENNGGSNQT